MDARLRDMTIADSGICAAIVCDSEIGRRYGMKPEGVKASLEAAILAGAAMAGATTDAVAGTTVGSAIATTAGSMAGATSLFVAELDGRIAGFAWTEARGAFCIAPYLRLIAVERGLRGSGLGSLLLAEFEARTQASGRDFCLLVSGFNEGAIAFYEGRGYRRRGVLPDFVREGIDEVLMVKPRGKESA